MNDVKMLLIHFHIQKPRCQLYPNLLLQCFTTPKNFFNCLLSSDSLSKCVCIWIIVSSLNASVCMCVCVCVCVYVYVCMLSKLPMYRRPLQLLPWSWRVPLLQCTSEWKKVVSLNAHIIHWHIFLIYAKNVDKYLSV